MNVRPLALVRPTLAGVLLLPTLGCGIVARQIVFNNPKVRSILKDPGPDTTVTHTGRLEKLGDADNAITVLYVTGTPYEMGYEQGQLLGPQVQATIRGVMDGLDRLLPKALRNSKLITRHERDGIVNELLDGAWARLAPFVPPEDAEELRGLADGSGVPLVVLQRMHAIPDVTETSCSALLARQTATRDGHTYQLRILDYGAQFHLYERPMLTVYQPLQGHAFVNVGWVGFIGIVSGMNDQGVGISEIGYGNPPGESLHGIPMPFLLKNVLRYANNAEQGAAIVRAATRTNSYIYFLGDPSGGVGLMTTRQEIREHRPNEATVIEERGQSYPQYTDVLYAGHFPEREGELIGHTTGKLDVAAIQDIARQIAMKSNLHTVIYDLTDRKLWVANRTPTTRAADRPYVLFAAADAWRH